MIEAIGHQYLDTYFRKVDRLLKPDGMALIQAITIEDHRYRKALRAVDFIKRHIFPGSFIPSVGAMTDAIARSSDMKLFNLEDIGPSYALTLRAWRQRFLARLDEVRKLGYPERFIRMWLFYLTYCEGGFHRTLDRRRADAAVQAGRAIRAVRAVNGHRADGSRRDRGKPCRRTVRRWLARRHPHARLTRMRQHVDRTRMRQPVLARISDFPQTSDSAHENLDQLHRFPAGLVRCGRRRRLRHLVGGSGRISCICRLSPAPDVRRVAISN